MLCYVAVSMKFLLWFNLSLVAMVAAVLFSCSSGPASYDSYGSYSTSVNRNQPGLGYSSGPAMSPSQLLRQVNLNRDYIPYGRHARKYRRSMNPRYITIHSTQNYSVGADARQHAKALNAGKIRASWHILWG